MKTKVAAIYGKQDIRIREFERLQLQIMNC